MVWEVKEWSIDEAVITTPRGEYKPTTADFIKAVKSAAEYAGLKKFQVLLNGENLEAEDAPELIKEGMEIQILKYDVAG